MKVVFTESFAEGSESQISTCSKKIGQDTKLPGYNGAYKDNDHGKSLKGRIPEFLKGSLERRKKQTNKQTGGFEEISTEPDKAKAFEAQRVKLPLERIKSIIISLSGEKETPLAFF